MGEQRTIAAEVAHRAARLAVDVSWWCAVQVVSSPPVRLVFAFVRWVSQ